MENEEGKRDAVEVGSRIGYMLRGSGNRKSAVQFYRRNKDKMTDSARAMVESMLKKKAEDKE
jgi:hypothetical protein